MIITENEQLCSYKNGNVSVTLLKNGTKIREFNSESERKGIFPESIDIKITNYCDAGCRYCHEKSVKSGKHADLKKLQNILSELKYTELALGGGNPLSHPDLKEFLKWCRNNNFYASLTVNQIHIKENLNLLKELIKSELIYGLGISFISRNEEDMILINELMNKTDNIVFHLINGINEISDPIYLLSNVNKPLKLLILGYKHYGRGINYYSESVENKMSKWKEYITSIISSGNMMLFSVLSFDNLAIEQFEIKKLMKKEDFDSFYQGDEFTCSMYIDAIEQKFSVNSRNEIKTDYMNIKEYFKNA